MNNLENMDNLHFDVLRELGNIGSGNAVSALAKIIGKKVTMRIPIVNIVEFKDIANFLGGPDQIIIGILVGISGDINGIMMFLFRQKTARSLANILMNYMLGANKDEEGKEFNEIELSALMEVGNILASSYLSSLAGITQKKLTPSVPYISIDMANAILSVPAIEFGKVADKALFIESVFEADQEDISGYFLLVPDMESFNIILTSLGVGK